MTTRRPLSSFVRFTSKWSFAVGAFASATVAGEDGEGAGGVDGGVFTGVAVGVDGAAGVVFGVWGGVAAVCAGAGTGAGFALAAGFTFGGGRTSALADPPAMATDNVTGTTSDRRREDDDMRLLLTHGTAEKNRRGSRAARPGLRARGCAFRVLLLRRDAREQVVEHRAGLVG